MTDVAAVVAEGFIKGVLDVLGAMMCSALTPCVETPEEVAQPAVSDLLAAYPVTLRAEIRRGGAAALLLPVQDAARLAAVAMGQPPIPKTKLNESDLSVLGHIAEPCLGGGFAHVLEEFGRESEAPIGVEVAVLRPETVEILTAFLGPAIKAAWFSFSGAEMDEYRGILLFSRHIEELAPTVWGARKTVGAASTAAAPLSAAEMKEIMGGFGDSEPVEGMEEVPARKPCACEVPARKTCACVEDEISAKPEGGQPGSMDRVLDIRVVATARLGRVEMPIGKILSLGVGSVIAMGRLVEEPVDLLVNGKLIARGDVVVVNEKFGLRITEIISPAERVESLHR